MFHLIGYTTTAIAYRQNGAVTHVCEWTGYPSASTNKYYMYVCMPSKVHAITGDHKLSYPQRKVIMTAFPSLCINCCEQIDVMTFEDNISLASIYTSLQERTHLGLHIQLHT